MIQDLHSHTYYSFCGKDAPETIAEKAIESGIELFGICDHNYGIGFARKDVYKLPFEILPNLYDDRCLRRYYDHINLIKEKYADKIKILRGIEISTLSEPPKSALPPDADVSYFDYCMLESIDREETVAHDMFAFAKRCGCPAVGIAHTDMFAFFERTGQDPYAYFKRMAEQNIFWEMNVSYDSIHKYRVHEYMLRFMESEEQQAIVRESGVRLSVGFDGHRIEDYLPDRVKEYCHKITDMGIKLAFE